MQNISSVPMRRFRSLTAIALTLWLIPSTLGYSRADSTPAVIPVEVGKTPRSSTGCPIAGVVEPGKADCDTALYEDSPGITQECKIPLILIHGIHGNRWPKNSGRNSGVDDPRSTPYTGYFPSLIGKLRTGVPGFDTKYKIYRFHYRSDKHSVKEIARSLRNRLDDLIRSDPQNFDKKFLIVAHSMGGLVARSYINDFDHDAGEYKGKRAGERISKLITLGTPHHGTHIANGDARAPTLNLVWQNVLGALDKYKWSVDGCVACGFNTQQSNRGDLLWNNLDGRWSFRLTYLLNPLEWNHLLDDVSHRYDHLVYPYWGSIDEGIMVDTLGKEKLDGLITFLIVQNQAEYYNQAQETLGVILHRIINADFDGPVKSVSNDGLVPDKSARFDNHSDPLKQVHCFKTNHQQLAWGQAAKCERNGAQKSLIEFLKDDLLQEPAAACPNIRVTTSLTMAQGKGPFPVGQMLNGSFAITNRGTGPVTMRQVLIGGRLADKCPNSACPDFSPVGRDVKLNPGQSYNYSGRINLAQAGGYTFYVAYETPDGKWEMPVKAENGAINRLSILVQPPGPVLTSISPTSTVANTNPQTINLYGQRLAKIIYAQLRLPSGKITYLYIPLNQVFRVNDEQMRISAKFPGRGTYYITVWTADGKSNEFPITIF